ncbi:30S ribosomal protein S1 [Rhynchospora pubera]|uniref:30S ribosomal protein S1 n=1 Tax=Rhynchospora pubera TaxID=906938 RepID=A0AAV8DWN7_9POAL|nr:30S ribosomal protein S1 [Rhynchospora pubera]
MPLQLFSASLSIPLPPSLRTIPVKTSLLPLLRRVSTRLGCSSQPDPSTLSSDPLELLDKPSPIPSETKPETQQPKSDLTPFLNLFSNGLSNDESPYNEQGSEERSQDEETNLEGLCYDPKAGEFAMGVVVSGDENKIEVDIGADKPGIMLKKEIMPLFDEELEYLGCDLEEGGLKGNVWKMGIVKDEVEMSGGAGKSVADIGTVVYTEVLGRTLGGRPLLSSRRLFRRLAWHRVRQIMYQDEPIEVKIYEWNTGGLLTRIEGLRAFLPKVEMMTRINNFTDYKNNVGRCIKVCIVKIDEATNDLIISEKDAWEKMYLKEGTLLQGSVVKLFPFGAQIRIVQTHRSGLLHTSNLTKGKIESVSEVLKKGEEVKVLVVKSMIPEKIALSIAELESEPGLFLSDKEKVFSEAEEMAKEYRKKLPVIDPKEPPPTSDLTFDDEAKLYSNWNWFRFERPVDEGSNVNADS